jgi:hypothetical protein
VAHACVLKPETFMGLVSNFSIVGVAACAAVYASARLLALVIVLRGTQPGERAELVRAVAELFHRQRLTARPDAEPEPPTKESRSRDD